MLAGDRLPIQDLMYTAGRGYSNTHVHATNRTLSLSLSLSSSLSHTHTYFTPMERSHTFGQLKRSIFSTLSIRILDWCCKISWLQFGIILGSRLLPYFIEYSAHCTSTYSAHLNFIKAFICEGKKLNLPMQCFQLPSIVHRQYFIAILFVKRAPCILDKIRLALKISTPYCQLSVNLNPFVRKSRNVLIFCTALNKVIKTMNAKRHLLSLGSFVFRMELLSKRR